MARRDKISDGNYDAFLAKYDASGNFLWVNTWGGASFDVGNNVALDGANVLSYGYYTDTVDFSGGSGTDVRVSNGTSDFFLTAFDAASGARQWTDTWGSADPDTPAGMGVDQIGNIYLGGTFGDPCDFDPGPGQHIVTPLFYDQFVLKFTASGSFQWVKTWGTGDDDLATDLAVSQSGETWACGYFNGTGDFDPGPNVDQHSSLGYKDAWVSRLDPNGNYRWARTWGEADNDEWAMAVAPDSVGNVYITGTFYETVDFDPGTGVHELTSNGSRDAYVLELDDSGSYVWAGNMGGDSDDDGDGIAVDSLGNILIAGVFQNTANISPSSPQSNRISNGSTDIFLPKSPPVTSSSGELPGAVTIPIISETTTSMNSGIHFVWICTVNPTWGASLAAHAISTPITAIHLTTTLRTTMMHSSRLFRQRAPGKYFFASLNKQAGRVTCLFSCNKIQVSRSFNQ